MSKRSKPEFINGYGGWTKIMNLPLTIKICAVGHYFGDLIRISSKTLICWIVGQLILKFKRTFVVSFLPQWKLLIQEGKVFPSIWDITSTDIPSI